MSDPECQATYAAAWRSPLFWIGLRVADDHLLGVDMLAERPAVRPVRSLVASRTLAALEAYFAGEPIDELPALAPPATPYQARVREQLLSIPFGQTRTYAEVATRLGSHPRAVGGACRANPFPLLVPCHRVVASGGRGGFAGETQGEWPAIKAALLQLERAQQ